MILEQDLCRNIGLLYALHLYVFIMLSAILIYAHFLSVCCFVKLNHTSTTIFITRTSFITVAISLLPSVWPRGVGDHLSPQSLALFMRPASDFIHFSYLSHTLTSKIQTNYDKSLKRTIHISEKKDYHIQPYE